MVTRVKLNPPTGPIAAAEMADTRDPDLVGGFIKGLRVLEAFAADANKVSIADIARRTGFDRAACRRLLLTLTHLGYAEHDGKFFHLTPRVLGLGHAYLQSASLPNLLQPSLERLARDLGESCSASVLDGQFIVYIARASKQRVMSINLNIGTRLPAFCSSMGRVLLASLPAEQATAILQQSERRRMTPKTFVDLAELQDVLTQVRADGFALVDEELELGLRSIAVPVHDRQGQVLAAINVGAQAARVGIAQMRGEILPRLLQAQAELRPIVKPD